MIGRAQARLVAMGYTQIEGVEYFETVIPTTSATPDRLVAAVTRKLDWYLRNLDVDREKGEHRYLLASAARLWIRIS
ncbi:unnamed protein product [Sphacelaria rigidula]